MGKPPLLVGAQGQQALNSAKVTFLLPKAPLSTSSTSKETAVAQRERNTNFVDPSTIDNPERDVVNFPRRMRPIHPPPVRLGFIPENWFTAFHEKTGVSGPYIFMFSVGTFLMSKEIFVVEHDFWVGVGLFIVLSGVYKAINPEFTNWLHKEVDAEEDKLRRIRQDEIDKCLAAISEEEKAQWMATSYETLIQAKKENVQLQLEAAYRQRLNDAYQQVNEISSITDSHLYSRTGEASLGLPGGVEQRHAEDRAEAHG